VEYSPPPPTEFRIRYLALRGKGKITWNVLTTGLRRESKRKWFWGGEGLLKQGVTRNAFVIISTEYRETIHRHKGGACKSREQMLPRSRPWSTC
jgi:hypothetical protein